MKRLKKIIKNNKNILLCILLGIIIMSIIYKLNNTLPFGTKSLLQIDFFHQYGPMLSELYDNIKSFSKIFYSFNIGLGTPYYRNFFNYLSSPINLIMLLFKRKHILTSYSFIIGIKAILSIITCYYYLSKKFNIKKEYIIGLSLLYAFNAYYTAYYWNIMWIDGLYILPLLTIGIENIINKKNITLYLISLTYMLYTNYFIGYMLCIYSVLYFIGYYIIKNNFKNTKDSIKIISLFIFASLLSGLINAWNLLPMYDALKNTSATTGEFPTSQYYAFSLFDFIRNHLTGVNSTVLKSGISNTPNISCGILTIFLLPIFILSKNIKLKRKILYTALLILLFISFYFGPIDYIWHAFHVPNDLPYRYSFIYSFILIIISGYTLKYINKEKIIIPLISYILSIILIIVTKLTNYNNITDNMLLINIFLLTIYFLIYLLGKTYNKYLKLSNIIFIIVCSIECIITVNHNWDITQDSVSFYEDYKEVTELTNKIKKEDNEILYRIEKNNLITLNDGAWYNYNGFNTFSSMAYNNVATLTHNLGLPGNNSNSYYYKQNTPIIDLMFNIKYTKDTQITNNKLYTYGDLNKFNYTTGLMFGTNSNIKYWNKNYINPFELQNDFISYSTNITDTLYRLEPKQKEVIKTTHGTTVKYTFDTNNINEIYYYTNSDLINYIIYNNKIYNKSDIDYNEIAIENNLVVYETNNYTEDYIIKEKCTENKEIIIYVNYINYQNEILDVYTINEDNFIKAYEILNEFKVNITYYKDNIIKGNINLKENKTIFTSIPYDEGWKVYVNGKKIKTYKIGDALLGFDLKKGKNKIELKYYPKYLNIGIIISVISLLIIIIYYKKRSNIK